MSCTSRLSLLYPSRLVPPRTGPQGVVLDARARRERRAHCHVFRDPFLLHAVPRPRSQSVAVGARYLSSRRVARWVFSRAHWGHGVHHGKHPILCEYSNWRTYLNTGMS